ncbi:histidine phosphatase family protein [Bacillus sp. AFS053548]|uniref:histidine phosphatase family protein n=1 Tax=Bacillus sp. AFS053548 TaxID=2033505 RepID=UPI000BFB1C0A|nr:histidine phosphatase family protein [Bacillus sp. AFS053548]PGM54882.1 phosphoglycerate mutase [Bacillus sp. AFS053548]
MTEICLVRHGQTDWNFNNIIQGREDIPLNKIGKQQANDSALFLSDQKWDRVITSPLVRARQTAQAIADFSKIDEIIEDERFLEREFGEASGKPILDVHENIYNNNVEGMETNEELIDRAFSALKDIAQNYEGKRIVIVAHSHTIKAILHAIDPEKVNFRTKLNNACANFIELKDGKWKINEFNISDHIKA